MVLGINTTSPLKSHVLVFLLPYKMVAFIYIFDECGISFFYFLHAEGADFTQAQDTVHLAYFPGEDSG